VSSGRPDADSESNKNPGEPRGDGDGCRDDLALDWKAASRSSYRRIQRAGVEVTRSDSAASSNLYQRQILEIHQMLENDIPFHRQRHDVDIQSQLAR